MREFWYGLFGSALGVLAGVALLGLATAMWLSSLIASATRQIEPSTPITAESSIILEIDLRGAALTESRPGNDRPSTAAAASVPDIVRAIALAETDPRVEGAILLVGQGHAVSLAHGEEISARLAALSQGGTLVVGYIEDADHAGLAAGLMTANASEVWASPLAQFTLETEFDPRWGPSDRRIEQGLARIAEARGLGQDRMTALFEAGPIAGPGALEFNLVDALGSDHDARMRAGVGGQAVRIGFEDYLAAAAPRDGARIIALIQAADLRVPGTGRFGLDPASAPFSASVTEALDDAALSPAVHAIVLRINAPDASAASAYQVAQAIRRAQAAGKPVIVSIGAAASGWAYYAASPADRILTPALASVGGLGQAADRLPASVSQTQAAPESVARSEADALRYLALIEGVAEARSLPLSRVDSLARGQLWTGAQAVELGLADGVGGLIEAAETARALAGAPGEDDLVLTPFPVEPTPLDAAVNRLADWLVSP